MTFQGKYKNSQNDVRGGAHLPIPPPPFKIRPCDDGGDALVITSSKRYVLPKPPIFLLRRAHTQRFQSADSGLDGCFQQKQSVIGSVGSSTSPDLPISYT